jgi:hypothetical protein
MNRDKAAGWALIAGVVMSLVTMANHPTGHDLLGDNGARQARLSMMVHVLALAALPLSLLGAVGLRRRIGSGSDLNTTALISYALAMVAVMSAAIFSGLVSTPIAVQLNGAEEAAKPLIRSLLSYSGLLNQAYAKTYVGFSGTAMALWGAAMLRTGTFSRAHGWTGAVLGVATVAFLFSGHMRLDVHGFGAVVLTQGGWLVACSVALINAPTPTTTTAQ